MNEFVAQIRGRRDYHHPWQEPIKNCQSYLFYVRRVLKKKGPRKILCKNSIPILTRLICNKDLHGLILPPLILDRSNNSPRAFRIFFSFLFFSPDFIQGGKTGNGGGKRCISRRKIGWKGATSAKKG